MSIELTESAANELRRIMQEQGLSAEEMCLRAEARGTGPQASYALDLVAREGENGPRFESWGIQITCDEKDASKLDGAKIDFREQWGARGFVFNLPERQKSVHSGPADPNQPPPDEPQVREALREVIDPEIGVNIVDLGLVYGVNVTGRNVHVTMTMTTPACPLSEQIKADVNERVVQRCPGTEAVEVELVWEPRWTQDMMTTEGKAALGWSR